MDDKAVWNKENVKHLCDICKNEVLAGHRPLWHLNKVGWKNVEDKFAEKYGKKLEHFQLKNKWDSLKTSYSCFMELKIWPLDLDGMKQGKLWIVMIHGGRITLQ